MHGILCLYCNFSNGSSYEEVLQNCHPNLHFYSETLTKFGIFCIKTCMIWDVVMDDWNLDENPLSKWLKLEHYRSIMSIKFCTKNDK